MNFFRHLGQKSTKFHAQLCVHSLSQLSCLSPTQQSGLVITIERSGKSYTTAVSLPDAESGVAQFQETLTFECTLFRDSETGPWSHKEYDVAVKSAQHDRTLPLQQANIYTAALDIADLFNQAHSESKTQTAVDRPVLEVARSLVMSPPPPSLVSAASAAASAVLSSPIASQPVAHPVLRFTLRLWSDSTPLSVLNAAAREDVFAAFKSQSGERESASVRASFSSVKPPEKSLAIDPSSSLSPISTQMTPISTPSRSYRPRTSSDLFDQVVPVVPFHLGTSTIDENETETPPPPPVLPLPVLSPEIDSSKALFVSPEVAPPRQTNSVSRSALGGSTLKARRAQAASESDQADEQSGQRLNFAGEHARTPSSLSVPDSKRPTRSPAVTPLAVPNSLKVTSYAPLASPSADFSLSAMPFSPDTKPMEAPSELHDTKPEIQDDVGGATASHRPSFSAALPPRAPSSKTANAGKVLTAAEYDEAIVLEGKFPVVPDWLQTPDLFSDRSRNIDDLLDSDGKLLSHNRSNSSNATLLQRRATTSKETLQPLAPIAELPLRASSPALSLPSPEVSTPTTSSALPSPQVQVQTGNSRLRDRAKGLSISLPGGSNTTSPAVSPAVPALSSATSATSTPTVVVTPSTEPPKATDTPVSESTFVPPPPAAYVPPVRRNSVTALPLPHDDVPSESELATLLQVCVHSNRQAFWSASVPESAVAMYRTALHWELLTRPTRRWAVTRMVEAINSHLRQITQNQPELTFWLSNLCTLHNLLIALPEASSGREQMLTAIQESANRVFVALVTMSRTSIEEVNLRVMFGEEGELGSPTMDRLIAVLTDSVSDLKSKHVAAPLRAQFIACLLSHVNALLCNLLLTRHAEFCSMETAMRVQLVVSMVRLWCDESDAISVDEAQRCFEPLMQMCTLLMSDKSSMVLEAIEAMCPRLTLRQIDQLLCNWNANSENSAQQAPAALLQSLTAAIHASHCDMSVRAMLLDAFQVPPVELHLDLVWRVAEVSVPASLSSRPEFGFLLQK